MNEDFLLEFKRQSVHLIVGLFEASVVWVLKPRIGAFILAPLAATILFLYYAPRAFPKAPGISHLLLHFERAEDISSFPFKGAFWFNVGIIFPVLFLKTPTACAVIAVLACGDSASTLVGKFWGKHRIGDKSFEGLLAFIVAASIGAFLFTMPGLSVFFALLGGYVEFFVKVNDNLSIPASLTLLSLLLGL
jgi:dolichol kinase